jgi:hypothetical protein
MGQVAGPPRRERQAFGLSSGYNKAEDFMIKAATLVLVAALTGYGVHALAQSRIDLRPVVTPMGSSSSNGVSFAWFFDSTRRTVYVCRTRERPGSTLECNASATLP